MTQDSPRPATLAPAAMIDSDHPDVVAFAREAVRGSGDRERAVALYYAVRDGFRYDPYRVDLTVAGTRASRVLEVGYGWCVTKAALLAAAARASGIAARVGFADVRNHLSTERMRQLMQTDLYMWHGYAELWIDGAWVKATPAFNVELCERFGVPPLEFDGRSDALFQPYDAAGRRSMEYVRERGTFDDLPFDEMVAAFREHYAGLTDAPGSGAGTIDGDDDPTFRP